MKKQTKKIYIDQGISLRDVKKICVIFLFICGLALIYFAVNPPEVIQEQFNENIHQSLLRIAVLPPDDVNFEVMDKYPDVFERQGKCIPLSFEFINDNDGWQLEAINKIDPRNGVIVPHMIVGRENVVCDLVWGGCFDRKAYYTLLVRDNPVIFVPTMIIVPGPDVVQI